MENTLDRETIKAVFAELMNEGQKDAALVVSALYLRDREDHLKKWAKENEHKYTRKIGFVKEARLVHDLSLTEAINLAIWLSKKEGKEWK